MSSTAYFAELKPDPALRRLVLWSGATLAAAGLVACLYLPLPIPVRSLAGLAWTGRSAMELMRLCRAWRRCTALRVGVDGSATVRGADGCWQPAAVLGGGIVLRHAAWIRLRAGSGPGWAEPLRGGCRTSADWRRLQVIWRHIGATGISC